MLFTAPLYLLLLVPAVLGLWFSFAHVHGMVPGRKSVAFALRFVMASCLILALAGPEAKRPNRGTAIVYLVDRSDSISDVDKAHESRFVTDAIAKLGPDDEAGVILFGGDARMEAGMGGARPLPIMRSVIQTSATDIAGAIRLGSALFPDGKGRRLVLLSDGNETEGDSAAAANAVAVDRIPIDQLPLGADQGLAEAAILGVEAPEEAAAKRPLELRVIVESNVEQTARIVVDRDDLPFKNLVVHLDKGKNAVVVPDTLEAAGFHRYRATLEASKDADPRNNVGVGFVSVKGPPKVLVLQDVKDMSLVEALRKAGLTVDVRGAGQLPTRADQLQDFDAVILNDFNAANLLPDQMEMLRSAAENTGLGLAMIGGENSFLPGGYYGSPIADALPVDLNVKEREDMPSTSIAIIGDVSGSMGLLEDGVPKVRIMAKAAEDTVNMLSPRNRVGVAGSSDGVEWVAPMQNLTNKDAIIDGIRKLDLGGGGIYAHATIVEAKKVLEAEHSRVRHFILLADGNDTEAQEDCLPLIAAMRAEHITTTTVAIGTGKDLAFLQQVAQVGGGRYYLADHANKLPAIMTQDSSLVARSAIEDGAFLPKLVQGEEILRGLDSTPPLLAYDLADARPLARVGMKTQKDDPLLATWQYGLATTLAFTSDAQARWASHWVPWDGFSTFWGQAGQAISRRSTTNTYAISIHGESGKAQVEVKASDKLGNPLTAPSLDVRVGGPDRQGGTMTLTPNAPGDYVGTFDANSIGSYLVSVVEHGPDGKDAVETAGYSVPYPAELRTFGTNQALLGRIRQITGGRILRDPLESLAPVANPGSTISPLWTLFLLFGFLMLPLDVAARRLALPIGEFITMLAGAARRKRGPRRVRGPAAAPAHIARLGQAKARAAKPPPIPVGEAAKTPPPAREPEPEPEPEPVIAGGTAAGRLLEAKRKRQDGER